MSAIMMLQTVQNNNKTEQNKGFSRSRKWIIIHYFCIIYTEHICPVSCARARVTWKSELVKTSPLFSRFGKSSILLDVQNLFAVIKAANLADAMVLYKCVTSRVGTLVHAGHGELAVVGASLVSASLRYFLLWYCHVYTSSCVNIYFTS